MTAKNELKPKYFIKYKAPCVNLINIFVSRLTIEQNNLACLTPEFFSDKSIFASMDGAYPSAVP